MKNRRITQNRTACLQPAAFTLTEVMIALAMVALLLVGISRIFAITSSTISSGQALSKAMRAQRAVQQVMSADFIGVPPTPGGANGLSGMMSLGGGSAVSAPMLIISNYRVATYASSDDAKKDPTAPASGDSFATRSLKVRTIDTNGNGSDADANETLPLYAYGTRNFRVDSIGFFTRGHVVSQTGSQIAGNANTDLNFNNIQNKISAENAWTWYGHLAVFNGDVARIPWQNAFGLPGLDLTQNSTASPTILPIGRQPNRNNQYANQFLLGRFQMLMVPPVDHDGDSASEDTVVAPDLTPVAFTYHAWSGARDASSTSRAPLTSNSDIRIFNAAASPRSNFLLSQTDTLLPTSPTPSPPNLNIETCRTDIAGVSVKEYYERLRFLQTTKISTSLDVRDTWWDALFGRFAARFQVNPYPGSTISSSTLNTKAYSQRAQILTDGCPQFMVEFAGDFVTQDTTGKVLVDAAAPFAFRPDGVIDFVVIGGSRQTRWYGLPRDVDGDGVINGNATGAVPAASSKIYSSPDVIPLRDMLGNRMLVNPIDANTTVAHPFEVTVPPAAADYCQVFAETQNASAATNIEPITNSQVLFTTIDTEDSGYILAWGPADFEASTALSVGTGQARPVPSLIRVIVDTVDVDGKLKEPVRQELVYPVPVAK